MIVLYFPFLLSLIACFLVALRRPGVAMAMCISLWTIKQGLMIRFEVFSTRIWMANVLVAGWGLLVFLYSRTRGTRLPPTNSPAAFIRSVFIAYGLASVFWSQSNTLANWNFQLTTIYVGMLVILLPALLAKEEDLYDMLKSYVWLSAATAVAMLFVANWVGRSISFAGNFVKYNAQTGEVGLHTANPLEIGTMAMNMILILILLNTQALGRYLAALRWPLVVLAGSLLLASGSRGQVIALGLTLVFMLPMALRFSSTKAMVRSAGLALVAVSAFYVMVELAMQSSRWNDRLVSRDIGIRTQFAFDALHLWLNSGPMRFLFGHGYDAAFDQTYGLGFPEVGPAALLLDLGLIGFFLWAIILFYAARSWFRTYLLVRDDNMRRSYVVALGAIILAYFALSFKESGYFWIIGYALMITRYEDALRARIVEAYGEPQLSDQFPESPQPMLTGLAGR